MASLSTHILDTAHGCPAAGVTVRLVTGYECLFQGLSDADGRCPGLPEVSPGSYRLEFAIAAYYRDLGVELPDPPFLDVVRIDFGIADGDSHYHVPLLAAPFGYSTYRGS